MIFGQLFHRESLSDLIICFQAQQNKSYHFGMGKGTSRTNLAKANENRDYRIYESFAFILVAQAQRLAVPNTTFDLSIDAPVYAIDATVIDFCLNVFWWGKFRKHKAAVKLHTMFDVRTNILEVASLYKYRWKHQSKLKQTQYEILQILSISLLCKIPLLELFSKTCPQYVKEQDCN